MSQGSLDLMAKSTVPEEPIDLNFAVNVVKSFSGLRGGLIPVLQQIQNNYGFIPKETIPIVARGLRTSIGQIMGVITFYAQFGTTPRGKNIVRVCTGTACHVRGGKRVVERIKSMLGIGHGETTDDRMFSYEEVACLGACARAPVLTVNDVPYGAMNAKKAEDVINAYKDTEDKGSSEEASGEEEVKA